MRFGYHTIGFGLLVAFVVLAFTFGTALLAVRVENYNIAVSGAFIMGGIFSVCLSMVLKKIKDPEKGEDGDGSGE